MLMPDPAGRHLQPLSYRITVSENCVSCGFYGRLGKVKRGSAVSDSEPQGRERGRYGVKRPMRLLIVSVNQSALSEPSVMSHMPSSDVLPVAYSLTFPPAMVPTSLP